MPHSAQSRPPEGRHLADHRRPATGQRVKEFLRLDRPAREAFHVRRPAPGTSRFIQFLRIARGIEA